MKKIILSVVLITGLLAITSCNTSKKEDDSKEIAKDENEKKFDKSSIEDDTEFAVAAADGGMMEVQLGQLALKNASSQKVKQFAQMMVDDHSKANEELKMLAASKNITVPAALGEKNQKAYNDLAEKKGADFDKAYSDFMIDDHKNDIEEFKKEANNGKDAEIKNWASGKISVLEHHLQMANEAKEAVK